MYQAHFFLAHYFIKFSQFHKVDYITTTSQMSKWLERLKTLHKDGLSDTNNTVILFLNIFPIANKQKI